MTDLIIVFSYAYLMGSIPFGLIITNLFLKKNIRKIGSGNIGATNVLRTGNKSLAALTLFFDTLKGYLSIYITVNFYNDLIYFAGLICFVGHIFSIWLKFKGGKGIATYLGIISAISLNFSLIFSLTWITVLFIYKYSSLSSIISTLTIFIYSLFLNDFNLSIYFFILFVTVLYTHRDNLFRLRKGIEKKISF